MATGAASTAAPPLVVRLAAGDIAAARASLIAVAHVNGLAPSGAERAIDVALGGALSRRAAAGLLDGHFGSAQFLPATHAPLSADAVLVLSLGDAGRLDPRRLPELGAAIVDAMGTMAAPDVATVVHGAGGLGLSTPTAARHLVSGLYTATELLPTGRELQTVTLVEHDAARLSAIRRAIESIPPPPHRVLYLERETVRLREPASSGNGVGPRHLVLGVTRPGDQLKVTVISENAFDAADNDAYPAKVAVEILDAVEHRVLRERSASTRARAMREIGEQLYETFLGWVGFDLPASIRASGKTCVVLRLDESTCDLPWELLRFARRFLSNSTWVARQREITGSAGHAAAYVRPHERLRAVVVSDPLGDLPGARREGVAIAKGLRAIGADVRGPLEAADRAQLAAAIDEHDPDVLHYAGHARFDPLRQEAGGLALADGILTAKDLAARRRLPRVVFANACNSAQSGSLVDQRLSDGSAATHDFAGGLLEGGVRSFIGSQWPVGDDAGVTFADAFYRELAAPIQPSPTIGGAVRAARRAVIDAHGAGEPAWAGYVHYGRPWQVAL